MKKSYDVQCYDKRGNYLHTRYVLASSELSAKLTARRVDRNVFAIKTSVDFRPRLSKPFVFGGA